jgi:hypothetical protein
MSKAVKAVLLSAFVIPGAGHLYLKRYFTGLSLLAAAIVSLYMLLTRVVERALEITGKIQSSDAPLDIAAITELVAKQPAGPEAEVQTIAGAVFIIAWLVGVVHSFILGRADHKKTEHDVDYIEL